MTARDDGEADMSHDDGQDRVRPAPTVAVTAGTLLLAAAALYGSAYVSTAEVVFLEPMSLARHPAAPHAVVVYSRAGLDWQSWCHSFFSPAEWLDRQLRPQRFQP